MRGFQDDHVDAVAMQQVGGGQSGHSGADDDHVGGDAVGHLFVLLLDLLHEVDWRISSEDLTQATGDQRQNYPGRGWAVVGGTANDR